MVSEELRARLEARLTSDRLTPMMRQYLTVKMEYSHAIVLFRMGDFFEAFFEDAEDCAKRLDITLTARSKERDIPMAGVPHHALDAYLGRLVEQGCVVVIVDQVEDAKQAKGLVRREVTRIVTPGTYSDAKTQSRRSNYLTSVEIVSGRGSRGAKWGLAAIDFATGEFKSTVGQGHDALIEELGRLESKELVVAHNQLECSEIQAVCLALPNLLISGMDERDVGTSAINKVLLETFGEDEKVAVESILDKSTRKAVGRVLLYIRGTQLRPNNNRGVWGEATLGHVHTVRPYIASDSVVLDRQAREHLELFRTYSEGRLHGSLLEAIDNAVTPMGGRLLVDWLGSPPRLKSIAEKRHEAVAVLLRHTDELQALRLALAEVSDLDRLVGRVVLGRATPKELVLLRQTLCSIPQLISLVSTILRAEKSSKNKQKNSYLRSFISAPSCEEVALLLQKQLVDEPSGDFETGELFRQGIDKELDRVTRIAFRGREMMNDLEANEREHTGISSLKVRFNKVFGYYIEVTKTHLSLVPDTYIRKQTTVNSERFFTEELKELEDEVLNASERRLIRVEQMYAALIEQLSVFAPKIKALAEALAELDVLCGFADLARQRDWVRPKMLDGLEIKITEGRHPVIEQYSSKLGEPFIANDICLSEKERLIIVTGPNMAGKSTIMRQTALIVILAYMGSFVPAQHAEIGEVDRIFTRVGASDDLSRGHSTFMVEMTETARILRSATDRSLVLLDEIGRGTSTYDGLSIAWAVAEFLHDKLMVRALFATHYHELTELPNNKSSAVNRHVAVREQADRIVFLRKLVPGPTNRSYGIEVARLAGVPASVLSRANEMLRELQTHALHTYSEASTVEEANGQDEEQLFLFGPSGSAKNAAITDAERTVLDRLKTVSVDDTTPRQALELLAEFQGRLRCLD